jgi:metal-dependent amidase/aminoacylase/carboxypeptidase family protein
MTASDRSDPVLGGLDDILPELEDIYKDLHANPELSMQEERTSGKAAEVLDDLLDQGKDRCAAAIDQALSTDLDHVGVG